MKKIVPLVAVVLAGVVVLIVAVGGSAKSSRATSSSPYGSTSGGGGGAAATAGPTLGVGSTPLGKFLVDGKGRSLYLFEADGTNMSSCSGACASIWPPLTVNAKPQVKGGVTASKVSTIKRSDGKLQVAYNGHALYYYAGDAKAGATQGQGLNQFGAKWYVVAPSGSKIDND